VTLAVKGPDLHHAPGHYSGVILVTSEAALAAHIETAGVEWRNLALKGKSNPESVLVLAA
jgi:hypothetical protein